MRAKIERRDFITLLGGAAVSWPLAARAQQPELPAIGFLNVASPEAFGPYVSAFRQGLGQVGYFEGAQRLDRVPVGARTIRQARSSGIRTGWPKGCDYRRKRRCPVGSRFEGSHDKHPDRIHIR